MGFAPLAAVLCAACGASSDEAGSAVSAVEPCSVSGVAASAGGVGPPDHIFGDVPDASLLPDSGFVAVDRQAKELHVFGPAGDFVRALGGAGEGPGELRDPIAVDVVDERVLVWDWRQSRITAFDLASGEVETYPVHAQLNPTHHFGATESGFVVGAVTGELLRERGGGELWTRDLGVVAIDGTTQALDTLVHIPDELVGWVDQSQRRTGSPHFSPRADVTTSGGRIYWARGDSAAVIRLDGERADTLRWSWPERPVTPQDVEAYRSRWLSRRPEALHPTIHRLFEVMPAAESFPAIAELVPDRDGGVWIQAYATPRDSIRTWLRLAQGRLACRVELPLGFIATEGGRSWLLGVATDDLGVQRVERWAVETGAPR